MAVSDYTTPRSSAFTIKGTVSPTNSPADFIAGCDGFHGISRANVKSGDRDLRTFYTVRLARILSETTRRSPHELTIPTTAGICALHMRSTHRSRYSTWQWSRRRSYRPMAPKDGPVLGRTESGADQKAGRPSRHRPSIEKTSPLRSFVAEPMRFGRMFPGGDAPHIVTATGARGGTSPPARSFRAWRSYNITTENPPPGSSLFRQSSCFGRESRITLLLVDTSMLSQSFRNAPSRVAFNLAELDTSQAPRAAMDFAGGELLGLPVLSGARRARRFS